MNAKGVILFDYAHTTPVYTSTLMASAFKDNIKDKTLAQSKKKEEKPREKEKSNKKVVTSTNSKGFWVFTKE